MALAATRIPGNIATFVLTGGGTTTAIRDLELNATQNVYDASAAIATFDQGVLGRKTMSGSYTCWLGTLGIAPAVGDTISVISVSVGADEVTPTTIDDAAVYGTIKVTGVTHTFGDAPSTFRVTFRAGILS